MSAVPAAGQRTLADSRRWMADGTEIFRAALHRVSDEAMAAPTALAGWTGRHVVAHVAANAEALRNLVHWARTGERRPMYASPQERAAGIEAGSGKEPAALRAWFESSAAELAADVDSLTPEQWGAPIVTAQGRTVAATEVPWMRVREVMVHAVDLGPVGFADLPRDFLGSLVTDVVGKRGPAAGPAMRIEPVDSGLRWSLHGDGAPVTVRGTLADLTAYLTGRPGGQVSTTAGEPAPELPPWL